MGEMAAGGEGHTEDGIARLEPGEVNSVVGLGAGVRLDVGVVGVEEATGAVDGEALNPVDIRLTAVIAIIRQDFIGDFLFVPARDAFEARVAFGIFIG